MGFYISREHRYQQFAEQHPLIKHNQPSDPSDPASEPRRSFFRINEEEELEAASKTWIHFPCFVMLSLSGGDVDKGGALKQLNSNALMFLTKLNLDPNNPIIAAAISDAYDITFDVAQDIKLKIYDDADGVDGVDNCESHFTKVSGVTWDSVGPIGDELYGWVLSFKDLTRARQ